MRQHFLIIGIDPGTTTAYAALDLDANLVRIGSGKHLDMPTTITEIIGLGRALVVGCDKNPAPSFVYRFATRCGARLVFPKEDLLVSTKKAAVDEFCKKHSLKTRNAHEDDALASAIFAYKEIRPQLEKIQTALAGKENEDLKERMAELVIQDNLSIKLAMRMAMEDKKDDVLQTISNALAEPKEIEKRLEQGLHFARLYDKLHRQNNTITILTKQNKAIKQEIERLQAENRRMKKNAETLAKKEKDKARHLAKKKEDHSKTLGKKLVQHEQEIRRLIRSHQDQKMLFSNLHKSYLVKMLKTLSYDELSQKEKTLNIKENDIIYVEDPSVFSERAISRLKTKVTFLVFGKEPPRQVKTAFICVDSKKLNVMASEDFAIVEKKGFDAIVDKEQVLGRVIKEYQESRSRFYD